MGMSHFSYIGLPQMGPTFITDEFFITPGSGCKKHHKIKGALNYYFKTIGYLKRVLCNPAVGTNAWFKMLLPMPGTLSRLGLACVASVSSRGSSRKLGQEQKKNE